ncbi:hypothetical protein AV530_005042 [Patagioenas fasciata monilis]|uniref:Uncharacterized protein n=1 Tax=Patagioenas fasciata monilis TaxID=372326 RepID=A0A1V4K415_PATFA|nr:hypothetical protein AV530_005042 [Patagioenas fasciata monilis]
MRGRERRGGLWLIGGFYLHGRWVGAVQARIWRIFNLVLSRVKQQLSQHLEDALLNLPGQMEGHVKFRGLNSRSKSRFLESVELVLVCLSSSRYLLLQVWSLAELPGYHTALMYFLLRMTSLCRGRPRIELISIALHKNGWVHCHANTALSGTRRPRHSSHRVHKITEMVLPKIPVDTTSKRL